jgi:uncharacterized protein
MAWRGIRFVLPPGSESYAAGVNRRPMPDLGNGLFGCYRCGNVWRFRRSPVAACPRCRSKLWNMPTPHLSIRPRGRHGRGIAEVIGHHRRALISLLRQHGALSIRVFGSVARGEAGPRSDVDLLVEFREPLGLLRRAAVREEAEALLGRRVELVSEETLHWLIRPQVLSEATALWVGQHPASKSAGGARKDPCLYHTGTDVILRRADR